MLRTPVPRNATELLELVENRLGWDPFESTKGGTVPVWKVKAVEAGKLNRLMQRDSQMTLEALTLALDYAVEHKRAVTSPYGLVTFVRDAVKWDRKQEQPEVVTDLEAAIEAAVEYEQAKGDEHSAAWLGRFTRAVGPARHLTYEEWKAARA